MSRFTHFVFAVVATTLGTSAFAQTPEVEPNGDKTEATVAVLNAGDCITGSSMGSVTGAGNVAADSADYWDISTAAQAMPGWYRWELTLSATGHDMTMRALDVTGTVGVGSTPTPGSDDTAQFDSSMMHAWYSNEGVSRVYIRITGTGTSTMPYTACLTCTPVASAAVAGTFNAGMIQVTTVGQTTFDTDISVSDGSRTIIPTFLNDDDGIGMPGLQSEFTRMYAPGTYYLAICDFDQNNSEGAAADDDFILGEVMDFPNVFAGSSSGTGDDLTFLIDDGAGNSVSTPATKTSPFEILFFEFTVGAAFAEGCNGDGGDGMGCTDCPCSNNGMGAGGCLNSAGTQSLLLPSGSATATGMNTMAPLRFECSGLPANNSAVLTSGNAATPANPANPCFAQNPGSGIQSMSLDGLRCVSMEVLRHGVRGSDANGDVGVTTNGWGMANGFFQYDAFMAGQTKHFQVVHRDDAAQVCMTGQNTTQRVTVTF